MTTLMTVKQAAEQLACSPKTIRRIIASGDLPVVALGKRKCDRIDPADLENLIKKRKRIKTRYLSVNVEPIGRVMFSIGGSRIGQTARTREEAREVEAHLSA